MTPNSNMDFFCGSTQQFFYNSHFISFPKKKTFPGQKNSPEAAIPNASQIAGDSAVLAGESSSSNVILGHIPGLRCNPGLSTEWSPEEIIVLKDGLVKYAKDPNMAKYIKIAAILQNKTVRDIALRCKYLNKENGKRQKIEEYYTVKKTKDRKEKLVDSSSIATNHNILSHYTLPVYSEALPDQGPILDLTAQRLLEENMRVIAQISANIEAMQLEENPAMFLLMRSNILEIQKCMKQMPGIMSQMHPLPESVDDELTASLLHTNQIMVDGGSRFIQATRTSYF